MTCPASGVEYGTAKRYLQSSGLLTLKGCCELPDCEALPSTSSCPTLPPAPHPPKAGTVLGSALPLLDYLQN